MHYSLDTFTDFLQNINLDDYRSRFSKIKTVEMDLPKNIQALDAIYSVYWNVSDNKYLPPPNFDDFYDIYYNSCKTNINTFWYNSGFCTECDCFPKGLKARIYRTWASLITQIHAGYVAEYVFGQGSVTQSSEYDHKGIDILVSYHNQDIKIQIKKESHRPEIERMHKGIATFEDGIYNIWYIVPKPEEYENSPYYKIGDKKGTLRNSLLSFIKYNKEYGTLDRLANGFVIFTTREFEIIKNTVDNYIAVS